MTICFEESRPAPPEPAFPRCPVCGEECQTLYKTQLGIIGCEQCVDCVDAWTQRICFEEDTEA